MFQGIMDIEQRSAPYPVDTVTSTSYLRNQDFQGRFSSPKILLLFRLHMAIKYTNTSSLALLVFTFKK